jgi:hypothetical protein
MVSPWKKSWTLPDDEDVEFWFNVRAHEAVDILSAVSDYLAQVNFKLQFEEA